MNNKKRYSIYKINGKSYYFDRFTSTFFENKGNLRQEQVNYHKDTNFFYLYLSSKIFKPYKNCVFVIFFLAIILFLFSFFSFSFFIKSLIHENLFLFSYQWFWGLVFTPIFFIICSFIHELGHVISCCLLSGAPVCIKFKKNILLLPMITNSYFIKRSKHIAFYYLSGPFSNLFFLSLCLLLFTIFKIPILFYSSFINFLLFLLNVIPIKKVNNDGYKALDIILFY